MKKMKQMGMGLVATSALWMGTGCASLNKVHFHLESNVSIGQQLSDLLKAKEAGAITLEEYVRLKKQVLDVTEKVLKDAAQKRP